ncbi:MAG TPA: exo-beta-N-acetylmuramidase NamZ domain-containing protein, partial [Longimicrobiales bacterium]|nr:exo-beta-N-acetylmuramidase NamZ domain-containing protein [Longimicrobiales bacterium]
MSRWRPLVLLCLAGCAAAPSAVGPAPAATRTGLEVLLAHPPAWLVGERIGLITNASAVDRRGRRGVDLLRAHPHLRLVRLFAFEHGLAVTAPPGAQVASAVDPISGLPVHSLYGAVRKPTPAMLAGLDALVFDAQEVGARTYTRLSTMALAMEAAAEAGLPFVVLDRPNPLGGLHTEGPVLDTAFASFVGMFPIPLRHGLTIGELALLFHGEFGVGERPIVIPME